MSEDIISQVACVDNGPIWFRKLGCQKDGQKCWMPLRCGCGAVCSKSAGCIKRQMFGSDYWLVYLMTKDW